MKMKSEVLLQVNGQRYSNFKSLTVFKSMESISGDFSFSAAIIDIKEFPIKLGDECIVIINTNPVITGFVEDIDISFDNVSHNVIISGRDKTCDVIDSSLPSSIKNLPTMVGGC